MFLAATFFRADCGVPGDSTNRFDFRARCHSLSVWATPRNIAGNLGVSLILQQFVRSVSWVMIAGLAVFCLLFFGGMALLKKRPDFERIRKGAIALLLPLSAAIALAIGSLLSSTYKLAVTKPWFGAQNVDVTAPAWLRGDCLWVISNCLTAVCLLCF